MSVIVYAFLLLLFGILKCVVSSYAHSDTWDSNCLWDIMTDCHVTRRPFYWRPFFIFFPGTMG